VLTLYLRKGTTSS